MAYSSFGYFGDVETPDLVLKSLFAKYDKDSSGSLMDAELKQLLQEDLGMDTEQAEIYTLLRDEDGSKSLTYEEFKKWLNSGENFQFIDDSSKCYIVHQAVEMFKKYDTDGQGSLDVEEFRKVMVDLSYEASHTESAVQALDKDGNGVISFSEFLAWLHWV